MKQTFGPVSLMIVILLAALNSALFDLHETEQGIVVQMGRPVKENIGPGLHAKIPFIQKAVVFKRHLLTESSPATSMLTSDKKNLVVDHYVKWRIESPLTFYEAAGTMTAGRRRVGDMVGSELRAALGGSTMEEINGPARSEMLAAVRSRCDDRAGAMGVRILDVRIRRLVLPKENMQAVYERMRMEREGQAAEYRAAGKAKAEQVKAVAERRRTEVLAEAYRQAEEIRGAGDAEAMKIYAAAYQQDPEFYKLVRTYEVARKGLSGETLMVLDSDYEILDYLKTNREEIDKK